MTPKQIAWQKFKANYPALFGLVYVGFCLVVAILGYLVVPDHSRHANLQVLEVAKQAPGTRAYLLKQPIPGREKTGFWPRLWTGSEPNYIPIALRDTSSIRLQNGRLFYTAYSGAPEQKSLLDFGVALDTRRSDFMTEFVSVRRCWLGTDTYGRDLLSRILLGTRVSLTIGIMAVLISLVIGISLGTLAGYFGGWVDQVIMWLVSVMWSIPTLLLALAIVFVLQRGFWQLFLAIGVSMWVESARIVRGQILSVREQPFAEAARAMGFKNARIMFRHVLPNVLSPIIVIAVANFGAAVLIESGLSFLGIGVEVPIPTWGRMIYEGYTYIVFENGKWLAFFPGLALILLVMSINLIGIGLRDALDVKLN
jgi:peptide/nickel transport system permease protein